MKWSQDRQINRIKLFDLNTFKCYSINITIGCVGKTFFPFFFSCFGSIVKWANNPNMHDIVRQADFPETLSTFILGCINLIAHMGKRILINHF